MMSDSNPKVLTASHAVQSDPPLYRVAQDGRKSHDFAAPASQKLDVSVYNQAQFSLLNTIKEKLITYELHGVNSRKEQEQQVQRASPLAYETASLLTEAEV